MKNNRTNATSITFNPLGESMTPNHSNLEKARACREAICRANSRNRRRNRAKRAAENTSNKKAVIIAFAILTIIIGCLVCFQKHQATQEYEPLEYNVYIGEGQWTTEAHARSMQWASIRSCRF